MGSKKTSESRTDMYTPEVEKAQSMSGMMNDYVAGLPALYNAQMQYMPQFAQLSKQINDELYPETAGIQEDLAARAKAGMTEEVPEWAQDQYRSGMNANLGTNVGSPIGADYASRGMMQLQEDWNRYYQNMALSVANRQPLVNAPNYGEMLGGYNPASAINYGASTYGTYTNAASPIPMKSQDQWSPTPTWVQAVGAAGGVLSGVGSMMPD